MRSERSFEDLFPEFPELADPSVLLNKEVLAHFGLLFSSFAKLEAALQTSYLLSELRHKVQNGVRFDAKGWEAQHEAIERHAFSLTFGNLLKALRGCQEIEPAMLDLEKLKKARDYFAHHFFREENKNMFSEEAKKKMLVALDDLRIFIRVQEDRCEEAAERVLVQLYPNISVEHEAANYIQELKQRYQTRGVGEHIEFGWEKHFAL